VLFPQDIASGALVAMALVDPIAGEIRAAKIRDAIGVPIALLSYFLLCLAASWFVGDREFVVYAIMAAVGSAAAIPSERFKVRIADDDFLMLVLPALAMACVAYLL
jgi:hypothetical protein